VNGQLFDADFDWWVFALLLEFKFLIDIYPLNNDKSLTDKGFALMLRHLS
jgi:hypothetical protein